MTRIKRLDRGPLLGIDVDWSDGQADEAEERRRLAKFQPVTTGAMTMYPSADGRLVTAQQDCFSDAEQAAHLDNCAPQARRKLAAVFRKLRERDATCWAQATEAQRAITWGGCWRYVFPDSGLTAYGYVETVCDLMDGEYASLEAQGITGEAADAEVQRVLDNVKANHERGWMSGPGFSRVQPKGEPGYSHVFTLTPVPRAEFLEAATAGGWTRALELAMPTSLVRVAAEHMASYFAVADPKRFLNGQVVADLAKVIPEAAGLACEVLPWPVLPGVRPLVVGKLARDPTSLLLGTVTGRTWSSWYPPGPPPPVPS